MVGFLLGHFNKPQRTQSSQKRFRRRPLFHLCGLRGLESRGRGTTVNINPVNFRELLAV